MITETGFVGQTHAPERDGHNAVCHVGRHMYFYKGTTSENRKRAAAARVAGAHGEPATGRIVKLYVGHGYGFIRAGDDCEVYFHRGDVEEGTSINDLRIGDTVAFALVDDVVSGPRALCVRRGPVPATIADVP